MIPCPKCGIPMTIFGRVGEYQAIGCSNEKCQSVYALVECTTRQEAAPENAAKKT